MSLLFITTFLIHCTDSALSFYYDPQLYVPKYRDYLEAQGNLTKDLFRNYEKDVSPVYAWYDTSKPLGYDKEAPQRWNYTLFLYSLKLVEVNEPEEQVSVVLELMEYWYDARLSWNASNYRNVNAIFTRQEKVWSPTLTPFGINNSSALVGCFGLKDNFAPEASPPNLLHIQTTNSKTTLIQTTSSEPAPVATTTSESTKASSTTSEPTPASTIISEPTTVSTTTSEPTPASTITCEPTTALTTTTEPTPASTITCEPTTALTTTTTEPTPASTITSEPTTNDNNIYQPRLSPKTKLTDENRFFKKIRIYRNDIIDFRDQDFRLVCLDNLGMIYDYLSARVSANCRMNVARFPFDTQICQIRFSLPIFSYKEVQIFSEVYEGIQNPSAFHNMGNSEWRLVNLTNRVDFLSFQDRFDLELAVFEIKITRNPLYYFYMIVFPSFVINSVSIMGIFLKGADKMSKLNVGLTNIMTMTFILGVMSDKIPRTGSIPLLGVYIIINLLIMLAAIFVVMMITKLRRWALPILKKKKTPMSRKLETFIGSPLEYTCAVILELITCANFFVMIGFWIDDQETVSAEAST